MEVDLKLPEKALFLFDPHRTKVLYGGRGSGKSWSMVRALVALAASKKIRILATREIQKSIKDSVHKLMADQIEQLELGSYFDVLDTVIRGYNGSEIIFAGLSNETAASIKSYEGVDIVYVEEAQTVTKKSWDILIPTIRKPGSEIWVSFNPELDTDDTYRRFVVNTPPNSKVEFINYYDNPAFPDVLEQERVHCKETDPDSYDNIWEGICKSAVDGAIYAKEVEQANREGRFSFVPYDPRLKVHAVWDLGWNDSMAIALVQVLRSEVRVIKYIEDSHKTLDWYAGELNKLNYNWGHDYLPHDGDHKDFKTGMSARQILSKFGRNVLITPNIRVEDGIKMARMMFPRMIVNKSECEQFIECLKRYRRVINSKTDTAGKPLHDNYSHGADVFRYIAVNVESMNNEDESDVPLVGEYASTY